MSFFIVSLVFGIIQISMWNVFPKRIRTWLFNIPLLAILLNGCSSYVIMQIAGTSGFIGSCNLTGSVIFAGYIIARRYYLKHHIGALAFRVHSTLLNVWRFAYIRFNQLIFTIKGG